MVHDQVQNMLSAGHPDQTEAVKLHVSLIVGKVLLLPLELQAFQLFLGALAQIDDLNRVGSLLAAVLHAAAILHVMEANPTIGQTFSADADRIQEPLFGDIAHKVDFGEEVQQIREGEKSRQHHKTFLLLGKRIILSFFHILRPFLPGT